MSATGAVRSCAAVARAVVFAGLISAAPTSADADDAFVDVTKKLGIEFVTMTGATGKRYLPETMLSGAAWIDYDGDGDLDLYLVQGHGHPDAIGTQRAQEEDPPNVLYRNDGGRRFERVPDAAGAGDRGYGMGVAVGDFDGDGAPDLFVANYGPDVLYRNDGGRFVDVSRESGILSADRDEAPSWSASATWTDVDADGDLDLYVVRYLAYDTRKHAGCPAKPPGSTRAVPSYCNPRRFDGVADRLYLNLGGGRFRDVSGASGIGAVSGRVAAKGLGVVASDFDGDGDPDILVANDSVANTLWRNLGAARFEDIALETGFAFNEGGEVEAGMGITRADVDSDGRLDYFLTHFSRETNTLYLNQGDFFIDGTAQSGLARASYLPLGFGARFFDYDLDGDPDLYVANGHVLDNAEAFHPGERVTYRQPDLLFENDGRGRFRDVSSTSGAWFRRALAGRCVAEADYDNDGDGDLVVTHAGGAAVLLENRAGDGRAWIGLSLRGRLVHGALVELRAEDWRRIHEVQRDGSYFASNDPRVRYGVPAGTQTVDVRVRWPGTRDWRAHPRLAIGRYHSLVAHSP